MKSMRQALVTGLLLLLAACSDADDAPQPAGGTGSDSAAAAAPASGNDSWPASGAVDLRRVREVDFTGDGVAERVIATARGAEYDSLDIAVTIESTTRDTLWHEAWTSRMYFVYDGLEGKADSTVQRIVQGHVDQLLEDDRFAMDGGLPQPLRQGTGSGDMQREALRYSLAELDYRRNWDLLQSDAIPPQAYSRIAEGSIDDERVEAALADVADRPTFMYFAGGEATYAIAWSERENAFVRLYSCC